MKKILLIILLIPVLSQAQITRFEQSNGKKSPSYPEGIQWWKDFSLQHKDAHISSFGETDAGYPLHIVWIGQEKNIDQIKKTANSIILINNAIHAGEPDGVDASMLLFRDLIKNKRMRTLMKNTTVVCIPYYNIGGTLNRNSLSRANQNGPMEHGFRGNAQNLDLNRDFIKCESKNALSFVRLLQKIDPDIYLETHVSNGADYQYTMTYLASQPDKLGQLGDYFQHQMIPSLEYRMKEKKQEMTPYVNIHDGPLKDEIRTFYDFPRYSTGLTALHNIFGIVTETHMLKPFNQRVKATYDFLLSTIEFASTNCREIKKERENAMAMTTKQTLFPLDWTIDTNTTKILNFKGYEYGYKKSNVTNLNRLYYNRDKPITKKVKYYYKMRNIKTVAKPKYYVLQKGYEAVADRLIANGVTLITLKKDTTIKVNSFKIIDYNTAKKPYERHYNHSEVKYALNTILFKFRKGDFLIPMNSNKNRFVTEVLEPDAPDSYFNWNFFDASLQLREWFSPYVFEDEAARILSQNKDLKKKFEEKRKDDVAFAKDAYEQLFWIYERRVGYQAALNRLPIFRIE